MRDPVALEQLLEQRSDIWRAGESAGGQQQPRLSTEDARLDARLGGGWPMGQLTELLLDAPGIGEISLLAPCLAQLTQQQRIIALVAPPYIPYAPALVAAGLALERVLVIRPRAAEQALWACEQILRDGSVAAALFWPERVTALQLRRLQLAAAQGACCGFIYRHSRWAASASTAALRLRLYPDQPCRPRIEVLKNRGVAWAS